MPAETLSFAEAWKTCRQSPTNQHGWRVFMELCKPVVQSVVTGAFHRYGIVNRADGQDLVQDILLKITLFVRSESSHFVDPTDVTLKAWVRAVSANMVRDWLRGALAQKRDFSRTIAFEDHMEELHSLRAPHPADTSVLLTEIDRLLPPDPKQRTVFWLYFRQGLTAAEIASVPAFALSAKGVESLLVRLTQNLKKQMRESR